MTEQPSLADDAFDDDLEEQLNALAPRPAATRATLALAGVVLAVAGFLGGVFVQKNYGSTTTNASTAGASGNRAAGYGNGGGMPGNMPSGFTGRQGQNGASQSAGAQGASGSTTTGKVKMVDGTTVYIETSDGQVITVKTSTSTTVQSTQISTVKDLTVGSQVTVEGTTADGTITASKVTKGK